MTENPDPQDVHELSIDILRACDPHFYGRSKDTAVHALVRLAVTMVVEGSACTEEEARVYVRAIVGG